MTRSIVAVTGLRAEATIAAGDGVLAIAGGGSVVRLERLLADAPGARAIISFGIAGGLAAGLPAGAVIVAGGVDDGGTRWTTHSTWRSALLEALPDALCGDLAGVDRPVADTAAKARLHDSTGALAVDMESHVAARFASRRDLPFAALRVVADPAERSLPGAALVGMKPDGASDIVAVLKALARRPADLPGLIRTALDAKAAFGALKRARLQTGIDFGFDGLNMARRELVATHTSDCARRESEKQPA